MRRIHDYIPPHTCSLSLFKTVTGGGRQVFYILARQDKGSRGFIVLHRHFPGNRCFDGVGRTQHKHRRAP